MFRLLVVDDEKNERDCLLYLIQNAQLPFEVREAENGADALRILEEWTADVILSDVQMPVMGGLEFLREACALYPETRVIIFSNYAEFEYAKAAMHLGVENYILKPVVPQELENTLNAVIEQITEERSASRLYQASMLQSALQLSIYGSMDPASLSEDLRTQLQSFRRMVLLNFPGAFLEKGYSRLCDGLRGTLGQEFVPLNLSPQALIFLKGNEQEDAHELGARICRCVQDTCGVSCCAAVSRPLPAYASLREAFSCLEQLMEQRFWNPSETVFSGTPGQPAASEVTEETDDDTLLNRIKDALAARDEERFTASLTPFFNKYRRQSNQSQIYVKFIFSNLIASLYPFLPEEEKRGGKTMDELISALYLQQDISQIIDMVQELARKVAGTFVESGRGLRRELVIVLDYIHQHYGQELSVELLASTVFLSPDYLSRIFKKAMGKSLYQYIRQFRMEKASELLRNTTKKVIDIGTETGYPNYSYFCQSFREYFGTSPDRYRQEAAHA